TVRFAAQPRETRGGLASRTAPEDSLLRRRSVRAGQRGDSRHGRAVPPLACGPMCTPFLHPWPTFRRLTRARVPRTIPTPGGGSGMSIAWGALLLASLSGGPAPTGAQAAGLTLDRVARYPLPGGRVA